MASEFTKRTRMSIYIVSNLKMYVPHLNEVAWSTSAVVDVEKRSEIRAHIRVVKVDVDAVCWPAGERRWTVMRCRMSVVAAKNWTKPQHFS